MNKSQFCSALLCVCPTVPRYHDKSITEGAEIQASVTTKVFRSSLAVTLSADKNQQLPLRFI